jgi:hypothetical protein
MRWKSISLDRLTDSIYAPRQNNEGSRKGGHVGNLNSKVSAQDRCRREQNYSPRASPRQSCCFDRGTTSDYPGNEVTHNNVL